MHRLASRIVFLGEDEGGREGGSGSFSLLDDPSRVLVKEGMVMKKGTMAVIKRAKRRHLLLFSDRLLVAEPFLDENGGKGVERITVRQIIDLRKVKWVKGCEGEGGREGGMTWEVEGRDRSWRFVCEGEERGMMEQEGWIRRMRDVLCRLAVRQGGGRGRQAGWTHRLVRGTVFSAAVEDDLNLLTVLMGAAGRREGGKVINAEEDADEEEEEEQAGDGREGRVMAFLAQRDEYGWQPIHYAAACGSGKILVHLLEKTAKGGRGRKRGGGGCHDRGRGDPASYSGQVGAGGGGETAAGEGSIRDNQE